MAGEEEREGRGEGETKEREREREIQIYSALRAKQPSASFSTHIYCIFIESLDLHWRCDNLLHMNSVQSSQFILKHSHRAEVTCAQAHDPHRPELQLSTCCVLRTWSHSSGGVVAFSKMRKH